MTAQHFDTKSVSSDSTIPTVEVSSNLPSDCSSPSSSPSSTYSHPPALSSSLDRRLDWSSPLLDPVISSLDSGGSHQREQSQEASEEDLCAPLDSLANLLLPVFSERSNEPAQNVETRTCDGVEKPGVGGDQSFSPTSEVRSPSRRNCLSPELPSASSAWLPSSNYFADYSTTTGPAPVMWGSSASSSFAPYIPAQFFPGYSTTCSSQYGPVPLPAHSPSVCLLWQEMYNFLHFCVLHHTCDGPCSSRDRTWKYPEGADDQFPQQKEHDVRNTLVELFNLYINRPSATLQEGGGTGAIFTQQCPRRATAAGPRSDTRDRRRSTYGSKGLAALQGNSSSPVQLLERRVRKRRRTAYAEESIGGMDTEVAVKTVAPRANRKIPRATTIVSPEKATVTEVGLTGSVKQENANAVTERHSPRQHASNPLLEDGGSTTTTSTTATPNASSTNTASASPELSTSPHEPLPLCTTNTIISACPLYHSESLESAILGSCTEGMVPSKDTVIGVRPPQGVYLDQAKRLWRVQWPVGGVGRHRKMATRGFSITQHGFTEARRLATEFKIMVDQHRKCGIEVKKIAAKVKQI